MGGRSGHEASIPKAHVENNGWGTVRGGVNGQQQPGHPQGPEYQAENRSSSGWHTEGNAVSVTAQSSAQDRCGR